jgi:hypothetical protein
MVRVRVWVRMDGNGGGGGGEDGGMWYRETARRR